jgi:hypothetical protein
MGVDPQIINPELEELVTAIAADPRATRFNIDPRKLLGGFRDGSLLARPAETGLTSAERELLRTHKAEAAYLLRALQLKRSQDTPYGRSLTQVGPVPSTQSLHRRVDHLQRHDADPTDGLLDSLVRRTGTGRNPTGFEVIAASLAIDPTASGVVYLVNEYLAIDDYASGEATALQLISKGCGPLERACAWQKIGSARIRSGNAVGALEAVMRSVQSGSISQELPEPIVVTGLTGILVAAIEAMDIREAIRASHQLADCFGTEPDLICNQAVRVRGTPEREVGLSATGIEFYRMNRESLSKQATEFIDALL